MLKDYQKEEEEQQTIDLEKRAKLEKKLQQKNKCCQLKPDSERKTSDYQSNKRLELKLKDSAVKKVENKDGISSLKLT